MLEKQKILPEYFGHAGRKFSETDHGGEKFLGMSKFQINILLIGENRSEQNYATRLQMKEECCSQFEASSSLAEAFGELHNHQAELGRRYRQECRHPGNDWCEDV